MAMPASGLKPTEAAVYEFTADARTAWRFAMRLGLGSGTAKTGCRGFVAGAS